MNTNYEILFLKALCTTLFVEAAVVVGCILFIPYLKSRPMSLTKISAACIIPSVLTLPYLWFVLPAFLTQFLTRSICGEIGIFLTEALIIKIILDISLAYSSLISFLANISSIIAGLIQFQ